METNHKKNNAFNSIKEYFRQPDWCPPTGKTRMQAFDDAKKTIVTLLKSQLRDVEDFTFEDFEKKTIV
jgi:hypothetical protein